MGLSEAVIQGLRKCVVASIGPTTSEELRERGTDPDMESSHPKMGFLVREAAERAGGSAEGQARLATSELPPGPCDASVGSPAKKCSAHEQFDHPATCRGFQPPQARGLSFCQLHARHLVELASNAFDEPAEIFSAHRCSGIHGPRGAKCTPH